MDADKLIVGVVQFVVRGWFVIKLEGGGVLFVVDKNKGKKIRWGGGHLSSHKLNITDEFTDGFNQQFQIHL